MKIILYSHNNALEKGEFLMDRISRSLGEGMVFHIRNTNALKHHLKQGGHLSGQEIFILLAETRQRLEEFISLADLLEDNRLVLVVPDDAPETLSRAQLLFPRFFTSVSERYDDLCSVVKQMIQKNSHQY